MESLDSVFPLWVLEGWRQTFPILQGEIAATKIHLKILACFQVANLCCIILLTGFLSFLCSSHITFSCIKYFQFLALIVLLIFHLYKNVIFLLVTPGITIWVLIYHNLFQIISNYILVKCINFAIIHLHFVPSHLCYCCQILSIYMS